MSEVIIKTLWIYGLAIVVSLAVAVVITLVVALFSNELRKV